MKPWRALLSVALPATLLAGLLGLASPAAAEQGVAREAMLTIQHDRVGAVRQRLDTVVGRLGGEITTERAVLGTNGRFWQVRVVIRVPARRFDAAINELEKLGTLLDQSVAAEDLATRIADLETVVVAQRAAVARRAQLTRHERALAALRQRVARPAITLRLVTEPPDPDPPAQPEVPVDAGGDLWWRLGLALLLGMAG